MSVWGEGGGGESRDHYLGDQLLLRIMESPLRECQVPLTVLAVTDAKQISDNISIIDLVQARGKESLNPGCGKTVSPYRVSGEMIRENVSIRDESSSPRLQRPCPLSCWTTAST